MNGSDGVRLPLVDDDPGNVWLVREAFDDGRITNDLFVARTGDEALRYLRSSVPCRPRPDLVLLDLHLPRMLGEVVLEATTSDPDLKRIPVIVLASSRDGEDVVNCHDRHANASLTKPVDHDELLTLVHRFEEFWIDLVRLPPTEGAG